MIPIRVLLADDHAILRESLAALLNKELDLEIVAQAGDGQEAIELAYAIQPDVVIMDIDMPRLNGIEATRRIAEQMPDIRVIGLSMYEEPDMARVMMKAGAVRYVPKDAPAAVLLDAIRNAQRRPHSVLQASGGSHRDSTIG